MVSSKGQVFYGRKRVPNLGHSGLALEWTSFYRARLLNLTLFYLLLVMEGKEGGPRSHDERRRGEGGGRRGRER